MELTFKDYDTLSEAMTGLIQMGYSIDFSILTDKACLTCNLTSVNLSPEEFKIDHWYHFDENSDPGDDMVLFAISSTNGDIKGYVLNAYGVYADSVNSSIMSKLATHINGSQA